MNNKKKNYVASAILALTLVLAAPISSLANPAIAGLANKPISGTINKTMNSGGYTYLLLQPDNQQQVWVAIPETEGLREGQEVTCQAGMVMTDFVANSLNKTFPLIIFSTGIMEQDKNAESGKEQNTQADASQSSDFTAALKAEQEARLTNTEEARQVDPETEESGGSAAAIVPAMEISVDKAEGENSYSVEECFNQKDELNGRKVVVRGKVVKVSPMIMGRNWIHIQDGTGNPLHNTHDLVITSQDLPEKGSVVTVEGKLKTNLDFGFGYKYDVLVEDAKVVDNQAGE